MLDRRLEGVGIDLVVLADDRGRIFVEVADAANLGREIDADVDVLEGLGCRLLICQVDLLEGVAFLDLAFRLAQVVRDDDLIAFREELLDYFGADEATAAGDEDTCHVSKTLQEVAYRAYNPLQAPCTMDNI